MKNVKEFDLDKYIDWDNIVDDFELDSGDLPPEDMFNLYTIFEKFINTNR
jgi:hypothetical protein